MVAVFEVDLTRLLLEVIHERDFKDSTTYLLPCMIYEFFRVVEVPIWHIDDVLTPTRIVDVGLIKDETNEAAPN